MIVIDAVESKEINKASYYLLFTLPDLYSLLH